MSTNGQFDQTNSNAAGAQSGSRSAGWRGNPALRGAVGFAAWGGVDTVMNMQQGDDFGTAAVKGAATGMLWTIAPGPMWAATLAPAIRDGTIAYQNWHKKKQDWWNKQHMPNFGGNYQDTQRALTMRQAAVQQIQGSKMNARSALGGEAKILGQQSFRG